MSAQPKDALIKEAQLVIGPTTPEPEEH